MDLVCFEPDDESGVGVGVLPAARMLSLSIEDLFFSLLDLFFFLETTGSTAGAAGTADFGLGRSERSV